METTQNILKRKLAQEGAASSVNTVEAIKKVKTDSPSSSASTASPASAGSVSASSGSISPSSPLTGLSSPAHGPLPPAQLFAAAAEHTSPSSLSIPFESELLRMTVPELKDLCRLHGYQVMGAKHKLIDRLTGRDTAGRARGAAPPAPKLKAISATSRKAMLAAGLSEDEIDAVDPAKLHKELSAQAKELFCMVDADWHDGYEEQGELLEKFRDGLQEPLNAVLSICDRAPSGSGALRPALQRCHEALLAISDGYANLCSVPMRGTVEDTMSYSDKQLEFDEHRFTLPNEATHFAWRRLLRACVAEGVAEGEICRFIKDAVDYGCDVLAKDEVAILKEPRLATAAATPDSVVALDAAAPSEAKQPSQPSGPGERLRELVTGGSWRSLPTQRKHYARKKVVDRRFFGAPNRRTRRFGGRRRDCAVM